MCSEEIRNEIKKKELQNCDFVKVVLLILVVFGHSIHFWTGDWFTVLKPAYVSQPLSFLSKFISGFHTYGFTMVSGYIYYYVRFEKNRYESFPQFILNKTKRLLIPYVFIACVWVIPVYIYFYGFKDVLLKFLLVTSPSHLWFLWMLFDVFVIIWPISRFLNDHVPLFGGCICVIAYVIGKAMSMVLPNAFCVCTALQYLGFFWIGFELRKGRLQRVRLISPYVWMAIYLTTFILGMSFDRNNAVIIRAIGLVFQFTANLSGSIGSFFLLQSLGNKLHYDSHRLFLFLRNRSMTMYLLHQPLIYVMIFCLNGMIGPYLNAAINFAFAMIASALLSSVLLSNQVTRFLIGEKAN